MKLDLADIQSYLRVQAFFYEAFQILSDSLASDYFTKHPHFSVNSDYEIRLSFSYHELDAIDITYVSTLYVSGKFTPQELAEAFLIQFREKVNEKPLR